MTRSSNSANLTLPDTQLQTLCAVMAARGLCSFSIQDVGTIAAQLTQHVRQPAVQTPHKNLLKSPPISGVLPATNTAPQLAGQLKMLPAVLAVPVLRHTA